MAKDKLPAVLFLCVHNAGRSQMALGWFTHLARNRAIAWSGGSEPVSGINPGVLAAMAEMASTSRESFQAMDRRVRPGCRCRHHDGLRRRLSAPARQALRGLGTRRPGRQDTRRDPADRNEIRDRVSTLIEKLASMSEDAAYSPICRADSRAEFALTKRRSTGHLPAETARASTSFTILEGTSEIQRMIIGRAVTGSKCGNNRRSCR